MPTDNALILKLSQAISNLAHDISANESPMTDTKRAELVRNAERLAIAAREPAENLYFQATQVRAYCEIDASKKGGFPY